MVLKLFWFLFLTLANCGRSGLLLSAPRVGTESTFGDLYYDLGNRSVNENMFLLSLIVLSNASSDKLLYPLGKS